MSGIESGFRPPENAIAPRPAVPEQHAPELRPQVPFGTEILDLYCTLLESAGDRESLKDVLETFQPSAELGRKLSVGVSNTAFDWEGSVRFDPTETEPGFDVTYKARMQKTEGYVVLGDPSEGTASEEKKPLFSSVGGRDNQATLSIKQLVRTLPDIELNTSAEDGKPASRLDIDLLSDTVTVDVDGNRYIMPFNQWEDYDPTALARELGTDTVELHSKVAKIINNAPRLRGVLDEGLRASYAENNYAPLVGQVRTTHELMENGYAMEGLIIFIERDGKLLLYDVPQGREKPFLGRFAGQLNALTESLEPGEDLMSSLLRALYEELQLEPEQFVQYAKFRSYNETDYGKPLPDGRKVLERCVVLHWEGPEDFPFEFLDHAEGGSWRWVNIESALGHNLEPNARPIIEQHVLYGLLPKDAPTKE